MFLRRFPWRQLVRRLTESRGFIDPVTVLSRLESFGQPMTIRTPLELLRSGLIFHARGLLNTAAIQHNLDWIWPFWVERQYDPRDRAFIPRAFSITHINLTHRNWTAFGLPGVNLHPLVDPRGLLTPIFDGWSLDSWLIREGGPWLVPSQEKEAQQYLDYSNGLAVVTRVFNNDLELNSRVEMIHPQADSFACRLQVSGSSASPAWLALALRPYNPEGVSFISDIADIADVPSGSSSAGWLVNKECRVLFDSEPARTLFSDYRRGDVHTRLLTDSGDGERSVTCTVGMATAASLFRLEAGRRTTITATIPLASGNDAAAPRAESHSWSAIRRQGARAALPEHRFQKLFDAALHSLVLHAPAEVYPGPYTYKRFWFRDAAFILNALLCLGFAEQVEGVLDTFPSRQAAGGFFKSQEGEWDSNGEALWIMARYCAFTGRPAKREWQDAIRRGARWIIAKRQRPTAEADPLYTGLLPAGFSAEHLGPYDYYYWDDFWGVAGLLAAAEMLANSGRQDEAEHFRTEADQFSKAIDKSLLLAARRLGRPGMPASPSRRLDSGAIGSLVAGYPLQLFGRDDPRLLDTVDFLLQRSMYGGGFFQDVIHSGINPYLTLHIAQILLRAGDHRALQLFGDVAALASPTGQWPEAIHPATGGGCMGDGHHVWASAEWVMMQRNAFFYEEGADLIIGAGIFPHWLSRPGAISFGPSLCRFGKINLTIEIDAGRTRVRWQADWHHLPRRLLVHLPGYRPTDSPPQAVSIDLVRG